MANESRPIDRRLWDAAVQLFAAKGFAATGIREIADQAGLSVSALYYYVDSKEDLLVKIMLDGQERILSAAAQVAARLTKPEERLAGLVQLHVLVQARHRTEALVIDREIRALSDEWRDKVVSVRDRYEAIWRQTIEEGATGKLFRIASPRTARLALLEMCNGVAYWYRPDGAEPLEDIAKGFADLALGLVRATRKDSPITLEKLSLPDMQWFKDLAEGVFAGEARNESPRPRARAKR